MKQVSIVPLITLTVILILLAVLTTSAQPAYAGATGSLTTLVVDCMAGNPWRYTALGGSVTITPPGIVTRLATDGNGAVVQNSTVTLPPVVIGGAGALFTTIPTKNPIHVTISIDGTVIADVSADAPCLPPSSQSVGFQGPGIPNGFVLKTVTCDMAVFDSPGGNPVGENRFTTGATWFMNPTPQKDAKGKLWTEVFVGGFYNGWIWTSCTR